MTTRFEESTAGQAILGAQMLFVAFGALVLVPILTGLTPTSPSSPLAPAPSYFK